MRTEPQFWSKAYDPVECTVEPLEQSQDWHKVVTICEIWCYCLLNHVIEMVWLNLKVPEKPKLKYLGFTYNGAKLFTMLPIQMRETNNSNTFKTMTNDRIWKNIPSY